MKFDLHMHSSYSGDGEFTPKQLIEKAQKAQLDAVALSDHDTVLGVKEMMEEGEKAHIQVIPAIECSTIFQGYDVHLLGYGIDLNEPYFQTLAAHIQQLMSEALHERVVKLEKKYHVKIDEAKCIEEAKGKNPYFNIINSMLNDPANAHIEDFRPYQEGGSRSDMPVVNFFWDKARYGTDLFVPVAFPSFEDTVKIIHHAKGLAVLAHPWEQFYENEELLQKALECGIDGIEVYSSYHEPKHHQYYEAFAKKNHLLITCGSDFHGKNKPKIELGQYDYHGNEMADWWQQLSSCLVKK